MRWPNNGAYTEAVRNYPHISIQDPKLNGGKPKRGKDGFLVSYAGGFSIVFPIVTGSYTFALRCWTENVENAQVRYKEISAYLKRVRLPYFVDFEYVTEGILIGSIKYPITRMEWADGVSLRDFISQNLRRPHLFKVVADEFEKMVATLHSHKIAHGDLQDGNILLKRNGNNVEVKLIDYDSLFVPALCGQSDDIVGLPEYQHPIRMADIGRVQVSENVDYFSELVIYLSFLALSEKPQLWARFGDESRVDRGLLFSEKDLVNPNQSPVFRELANLSPDVQELVSTLKDFIAKTSIDQLEPLEAIVPKSDANTHTNRGDFFLDDKRYDEALVEFQNAINLDSQYERAHRGIGLVYLHTKRYADAINAFQQAIQLDPNYKEAHHGLAFAYFKSGDNNKATVSADAALKIDPYYQPPRHLLGAIKSSVPTLISSSSAKSTSTAGPPSTVSTTRSSSTKSKATTTSRSTPASTLSSSTRSRRCSANRTSRRAASQSVRTSPVTNIWQYITGALENNRHAVVTGVLGLALVVSLIALLTQGDTGGEVRSQIATLKGQLAQKEMKIQGLTSSVQTLEGEKEELVLKNGKLQDDLEHLKSLSGGTYRDVIELRKQLTGERGKSQLLQNQLDEKKSEVQQLQNSKEAVVNENRRLQNQLAGRNPENPDQDAILQQLRSEKAIVLKENQELRNQLSDETSKAKNLATWNQQLQSEKAEIQSQNQQLKNKNRDFTRENQKLRAENNGLKNKPIPPDGNNLIIDPEPPKKIRIQNYRNVVSRAVSRNNQGCIEFERNNYDKAIRQFEQAIRADSEFAVAHYNLGCAYLEVKEYSKAISAFGKAVAVNYKLKEAYYNLGITHLRKGARQAAKSSVELALTIDKNYLHAHNLLRAIENAQQ